MNDLLFLITLLISIFLYAIGAWKENAYIFLIGSMLLFATGVILYAEGIDQLASIDAEGVLHFSKITGQNDVAATLLSLSFAGAGISGMCLAILKVNEWKKRRG